MSKLQDLSGRALWNKSIEVIIGGCGLLSKRPTRYCAAEWPAYYSDAKGCKVKAINEKWYYDFTEFSIGCNILGYANREHLNRVPKRVFKNPLTSLLSPYEPRLACLLNSFIGKDLSWKFCRGGGEALALCARYARSAARNTRVLVCGYHGWHDWYLASNIKSSDEFDKIFLAGLNTNGIPEEYEGTTQAVSPSNMESLKTAIESFDPGTIIFESARYEKLESAVVDLLKQFQAGGGIIVSDEVTSGFRFKEKLACLSLGLDPDFVVLGKSLGNGFTISGVGIQKKYHNSCEQCFASSTHWTEQIGLAAGCSTILSLKDWEKFYIRLEAKGERIRETLISCFSESKTMRARFNSLPTMISFQVNADALTAAECKAILCRRLLSEGILFSNTIYPSLAHSDRAINHLSRALKKVIASLDIDIEKHIDLIKSEIDALGSIETGFARTQSL